MNTIIRQARLADAKNISTLVYQLAIYEKKLPSDIKLTEAKIIQDAFGTTPYFHILVAESAHQLIGYALYFFTYAGSLGAPILYLEDLFVLEEARKKGVGTQLLSELAKIARQANCCRMEWHAYTWNDAAIKFYGNLGASLKTDLVQVRLPIESSLS